MAASIGRLVVDCGIDENDEGFEQVFHLTDQAPVGKGNGCLRCKRFSQMLVGPGKCHDLSAAHILVIALLVITLPVITLLGIDELQHADDFVLVVAHRHREK